MFTLTVSSETKKQMKMFGIKSYPFTYENLRKSYLNELKLIHPDKVDEKLKKAAEEKTKKLILAYKTLVNISTSVPKSEKVVEKPNDIFDLSEKCPVCWGVGKVTVNECIPCDKCDNFGKSFYRGRSDGYYEKCRACNGTGKFTQIHTKKVVTCLRCKGSGTFLKKCTKCGGKGVIMKHITTTCSNCNGTGRVEMDLFNPVIPKGAVL